ncbi:neuropeptide Y receptor type 4-2-like [Hyla sarda]|uniref:neuropeptide Y receptor type 4-2-like n=1 Tax=Hyla sarda TaxID=327740 RepID=UPI0024C2A903|nr:neuropeptide Y receptor type 4-2-like [Hyla sarda]XP_056385349.1 neuropeptide Y receptor type 4-2-like [Hyla sarda]
MNHTLLFDKSSALQNSMKNNCDHSPDVTPFLGTSYSLLIFFCLLGNSSLIYVIWRRKEKGNVTHILIANLAFSDILVGIFCLPFTVVYTIMDYWMFGRCLCKITNFIGCASVTVSIMILVLIALERHQLIIHPTGWKPSGPQAYTAVLLVWGLASLLALPLVYAVDLQVLYIFPDKSMCVEYWTSGQQRLAYTVTLLLLQYVIPLCFIICCYVRISVHLQRREGLFGRSYNHMRRVNLMLASMLGAFAVCYLPLHIFNNIVEWNHQLIPVCYHNLIFALCHLVAMISTCINPIIYGLLNSNVKQEVKILVQRCKGQRKKGADTLDEAEKHPLSTKHPNANAMLPGSPCTEVEQL